DVAVRRAVRGSSGAVPDAGETWEAETRSAESVRRQGRLPDRSAHPGSDVSRRGGRAAGAGPVDSLVLVGILIFKPRAGARQALLASERKRHALFRHRGVRGRAHTEGVRFAFALVIHDDLRLPPLRVRPEAGLRS